MCNAYIDIYLYSLKRECFFKFFICVILVQRSYVGMVDVYKSPNNISIVSLGILVE